MARRKSDERDAGQPLSRERIVQAALDEVAENGLSVLSMRRVAERLGCEAMSLYHHFPSKQHLLDAMVDHAIGSIPAPPAALAPMARLRHAIDGYRAMANRFPALFALIAVHRLNTPVGVRYIESILALIRAAVPDDELAARHFRVIGYYIVGAGLDESAGYAEGPSAAEPVDGAFIARECPQLVRAAPYFQRPHWDATFALGVDALLAALQRDAARLRRAARAG